jgi:hypothetical protein
MLPLPRVGDALLAHCLNCIRVHRACQSIPRSFPPSSHKSSGLIGSAPASECRSGCGGLSAGKSDSRTQAPVPVRPRSVFERRFRTYSPRRRATRSSAASGQTATVETKTSCRRYCNPTNWPAATRRDKLKESPIARTFHAPLGIGPARCNYSPPARTSSRFWTVIRRRKGPNLSCVCVPCQVVSPFFWKCSAATHRVNGGAPSGQECFSPDPVESVTRPSINNEMASGCRDSYLSVSSEKSVGH